MRAYFRWPVNKRIFGYLLQVIAVDKNNLFA